MSATNPAADRTGNSAKARVEAGKTYKGSISAYRPDANRYDVVLDDFNATVSNCIWAAGIFSALVGIRASYIPPIGTRVSVSIGDPSWIIGMAPDNTGEATRHENTIAGAANLRKGIGPFNASSANAEYDGHDPLGDLLPGELDLTNILGVGIQLLTHFTKLSAGDLVKVECHMLNDMVRVLSENFRQHTGFGDLEFYNDGRLNVKINGTSYPHEAWGVLNENDKKLDVDRNKGVDVNKVDSIRDTGRWRFSSYVGFLGNFLHTFITDPTAAIGKLAADNVRSGKFRTYAGNDGSFLLQSVSEIAIERVCRIPVPVELKRWDDPEGVLATQFNKLDREFLRIWQLPKDPKDVYQTAFQLREYSRYLSNYHSLSRFLQMDKAGEFKVPTEQETPAPSWLNSEKDVEDMNRGIPYEYIDTYACWRILKDGSIVFWAGDGSAIVLARGETWVSATTHLNLEAAGDIRMIAGQNIFLKARRSIEIAAITGGLRLKARAWLHALCEWGTLWLKSDAKDPSRSGYSDPQPENDKEDPTVIINDAAILLDTTQGRTILDSERTILLNVKGRPDSTDDPVNDNSASVVIQSRWQHVKITAEKTLSLQALHGLVILRALTKSVVIKGRYVWMQFLSKFRMNNNAEFDQGGLKVSNVKAERLSATNGLYGPEVGGPTFGGKLHYNHIYKIPENSTAFNPALKEDTGLKKDTESFEQLKDKMDDAFPTKGELTWRFERADEYNPYTFPLHESLTQQHIRLDLTDSENYDVQGSDNLKPAPRTDAGTAPWPGVSARQKQANGGESLHKPSGKKGSDHRKQTAMQVAVRTFRYLKRSAKL